MEKSKTTKKSIKKISAQKNSENLATIERPVTRKKINLPLILGIIIIALLTVAYYRYGVVAVVNGHPISRYSYLKNLEKQDNKQELDVMINETLVFTEATKKGITIDQSVIDEEINKIDLQVKEQGQSLDEALKAENMTKTELEKQIRLQKIVEKLANVPTEVNAEEITKFLTDNKAQLPKDYSKTQLDDLAKTQILSQKKTEAINAWFTELKKSAQIIYR